MTCIRPLPECRFPRGRNAPRVTAPGVVRRQREYTLPRRLLQRCGEAHRAPGACLTGTGEGKAGNKAQRGKTQPRSARKAGDRALTAAARRAAEAAEPQCGAWDPHPGGASRPRRLAQLTRPRREATGGPGSGRPPGQARTLRSILQPAGRARPPPRRGPGYAHRAPPGPAPAPPRAHPSVRPSRSRRCGPCVRLPRGSGDRRAAAAQWPGRARDQQAAPGRARRRGALRQRSSLGSVVRGGAPRPRGGGTPYRDLPCRCPLPESTSRPRHRPAGDEDLSLGKTLCWLF